MKVQFKNLSEELESQRNLHRTTLKRANEAETQLKENQQRVTGLEGELLTSDVERDQLKDAKRKVRLEDWHFEGFVSRRRSALHVRDNGT